MMAVQHLGHYLVNYLTIILRGRAGYEMIYITNEARSAELVMIISYPASPSRIIVLLKTPTSQLFYVKFIWPFFSRSRKTVYLLLCSLPIFGSAGI